LKKKKEPEQRTRTGNLTSCRKNDFGRKRRDYETDYRGSRVKGALRAFSCGKLTPLTRRTDESAPHVGGVPEKIEEKNQKQSRGNGLK